MKKVVNTVFVLLCFQVVSYGQALTGTKTIKFSGGNYTSLAAAITDLNSNGVGGGGVTFNIDANYTETLTTALVITATGTSSKQIIFQKIGSGSNPKITAFTGSGSYDGIITLAGTDYITIDGLDLQESSSNTNPTTMMEWGYGLLKASTDTSGCQHVTIRNCTITLNKTNTNASTKGAIYLNNALALSPGTSLSLNRISQTNSYNRFYYNTLTNTLNGFYISGYSYVYYDQNNYIGVDGGNNIINFGNNAISCGVWALYQSNMKIANNTIKNIYATTNQLYGIIFNNGTSTSTEIYNNLITLNSQSPSSYVSAISNATGSTASASTISIHHNIIRKCRIALATSSSEFYGIYNSNNGADNVYIKNNIIDSNSHSGTGGWYGISIGGSYINRVEIDSNIIDSITKTNTGNILGIGLGATANNCKDLIFDNRISRIKKTVYSGIIQALVDGNNRSGVQKEIFRNNVFNINTAGSTIYGIYVSTGDTIKIYKNSVYDISSSYSGYALIYGINNEGGIDAFIFNNFVYELRATASSATNSIYGICISMASNTNSYVYFNTVYLDAISTGSNFGTVGVYLSNGLIMDVRNNIIVNTSMPRGTGYTIALQRSYTTTYSSLSNNNCLYAGVSSAKKVIYYDGTNYDTTIVQFINRMNGPDNNSFSENPPFLNTTSSPYNVHLSLSTPTLCESGGVPVNTPISITDDFDNNLRNNLVPDVGADEGNFSDLRGPVIQCTPLTNTASKSNRMITATMLDVSGVPTIGTGLPVLYWKINNASTFNSSVGSSLGNNQFLFSFGNGVVTGDSVKYYIVSQDSAGTPNASCQPSNNAAGFTINPPAVSTPPSFQFSYKIIEGIASGNNKIGGTGTTPATGCTYVDLTAAFADIYSKEILGAINLVLTKYYKSSEEVAFPIILNSVLGSTSSNTITIKPDSGTTDTIAGLGVAIFKFNNAANVIIDGSNNNTSSHNLLIQNNITLGRTAVIWFYSSGAGSGCVNNTIKNCYLRNADKTVTTMYGISIGSTIGAAGNDNDYNTITNNVIQRAYYGIFGDASTAGRIKSLTINNNILGDSVSSMSIGKCGIYLQYSRNAIVRNNSILNMVSNINNPTGIYLGNGVDSSIIEANIITGLKYTGTQGYGGKGIDISLSNLNSNVLIANNSVSDILGDGWSDFTTNSIVGIRIMGFSGGVHIYNNSVNLTGNANRSTVAKSTAIYFGSNNANLDVRNNIFSNSIKNNTTSSSIAYAIYSDVANSAYNFIDYNDYYISGSQGVFGYLSSNITTLNLWKTTTEKDTHSVNLNPFFVSPTNLHVTTATLNNTGIPLSTITKDIEGNTRSSSKPDIGAYEFGMKPRAITGTTTLLSATTATIYGTINDNNEDTTRISFRYGLTTLYDSNISATPSIATGLNNTSVGATLNSLIPNSLYHYSVVGTNSIGTSYGVDSIFNTPAVLPLAQTLEATVIDSDSALIQGRVKAMNATTTVTFEFGLTTTYGIILNAIPDSVNGMSYYVVTAKLKGLLPNTMYHYRIVATNKAGTIYGKDSFFLSKVLPPIAITETATNIGYDSATLQGNVNANNDTTDVYFEYGTSKKYSTLVKANPKILTDHTLNWVNYRILGLIPNSHYHYRVIAINHNTDTTSGADSTFITKAKLADVVISDARLIGYNGASLNGSVNANNSSTAVGFEFGTTIAYGINYNATPDTVNGTASNDVNFVATGLNHSTVYHYRIKAKNLAGTVYSNDTFFRTLDTLAQLLTIAPTSITNISAISGGVIFDAGGLPIIIKGVCWSSFQNPDTTMSKTNDGSGSTTFNSIITGLHPNTTYYIRSYAINSLGISYGNQQSFTTQPNSIEDHFNDIGISIICNNKLATINIDCKDKIIGNIQVFDLNGKKIFDQNRIDNQNHINFTEYAEAYYLIVIRINNKDFYKKVLIK